MKLLKDYICYPERGNAPSQCADIADATVFNDWINARDFGASGSEFESVGRIAADSNEIILDDVGDFEIGQEITISHCNPHYYGTVYNTAEPYLAKNQKLLEDELELRGLDDDKAWQTFVIHFEKTDPVAFSWMAVDPVFQTDADHDPIFRPKWSWQGKSRPVDDKWFSLTNGVEARFKKIDWEAGQSISFHARNRLIAKIIDIKGNKLILSESATKGADKALIRHHDQAALQVAVNAAVQAGKGLFIPTGRYRLNVGLWIENTSLRIEGAHRESVILDITEAHTAAFWISGGKEITVRNLGIVGHTGFLELPGRPFTTATGYPFWPMANELMEVKGCAAANIVSVEHLLFEDVNATRMASEAFYLHGAERFGSPPYIQAPHEGMTELREQYTKSCIFHRCHVADCVFNAFNNNDHGENTSILHCHVERVGNLCEGAGRFTRIIGNYLLDGCCAGIHGGGKEEDLLKLGPCQAIISDNVFEGGKYLGGITIGNSASQVIIANNMFVGFSKESAITVLAGARGLPCRSVTITGNDIDLSRMEGNPDRERVGMTIEASNVIIANNHISLRGKKNAKVTGIQIADHAVNIHVHDNIIENCDCGLRSGSRVYVKDGEKGRFEYHHTESEVVELVGACSFRDKGLPRENWNSDLSYCKWHLQWLTGKNSGKKQVIESYNAGTREFKVKEGVDSDVGDRFFIYPDIANWQIHNNTMVACEVPMQIDLLSDCGVNVKDNANS